MIIKRDPVTVGVVFTALVLLLGNQLGWPIEATGSVTVLIAAGVAVVQVLNVFGSDKFTAAAVQLVVAGIATFVAWGIQIPDETATLIIGLVVAVLGFFSRNGVTNRHTVDGLELSEPFGTAIVTEIHNH